ncbi:MAG: CopD family protein [Gammaproteobacteria bacterium]|nr:CopD family protein [Gammaproteobacteria bacterium]MDH5734645.1 CopD family protein [Gammaproteobacteria bacterium]
MLWVKAFHVIFMVTWFAGLFYLPRLFVYHAQSSDPISIERFKIMERKLFYGIMTPGGIITAVLGLWMLFEYAMQAYTESLWLYIKLALTIVLIIYHGYCWKLLQDFKFDRNEHSHVWYRWFNEFPVLILIAIIILVIVKPV